MLGNTITEHVYESCDARRCDEYLNLNRFESIVQANNKNVQRKTTSTDSTARSVIYHRANTPNWVGRRHKAYPVFRLNLPINEVDRTALQNLSSDCCLRAPALAGHWTMRMIGMDFPSGNVTSMMVPVTRYEKKCKLVDSIIVKRYQFAELVCDRTRLVHPRKKNIPHHADLLEPHIFSATTKLRLKTLNGK